MKITLTSVAAISFLLILMSGCTSSKQVIYFQDLKTTSPDTAATVHDYRIQPNDILQVTVTSLNAELDQAFARSELRIESNGTYMTGYLVDSAGNIGLPYAGYIKVGGTSLYEAKTIITDKLTPSLKQPIVNIRIANYSISVIGEVNRAGTFTFPAEPVTVTQALSMAGDLTINAKRDSILVIREILGKRQYVKFDLRKADILSSPYYYLHNRDVLYIPPAKSKIAQADTRRWQILAFVTTVLSLTTVIISRVN
jgi:polysaccharide biosynthesis/export protein